jgi:two-component system cell cycle sensor histidine kinase/response regulator CckA
VRVIMSSGYTESEITPRFAGKRLSGFLQKPYTLDTLTQRLRDALERR